MFYTIFFLFSLLNDVHGYYSPKTFAPPYDTTKARIVKCSGFNLMKVGCYHERDATHTYLPLALPELLLTAEKSSPKYVGYERFSFPTYGGFLERFVCDCADKVRSKRYVYFSLQNYFECWSGKSAENTYNKYRDADGCIRGDKTQCNLNSQGLCAGTGEFHFVYTLRTTPPTTAPPKTNPPPTTSPTVNGRAVTVWCGHVEYKVRKVGCWIEQKHARAFPELLLTARNPYKGSYVGYFVDTKDYQKFIRRFICDCATKVTKKGYSMFGLQSYSECWSGPQVACSYKKTGKTNGCINQKKWQCFDDSSLLCSSTSAKAIYAYVLEDSPNGAKCPVTNPPTPRPKPSPVTTVPIGPPTVKCGNVEYKLTKLGCWNELGDRRPFRAFSELLLTARDTTDPAYVGYEFHKRNYKKFLQRFVCDCVEKVSWKGYSVFGLQFYGECWSGPRAACTYKSFGKGRGCVNEKMTRCSDRSSLLCSGDSSQHVYAYVRAGSPGGATCPTKSPSTPPPKTVVPIGPPTVKCGKVEYKLTKLGCWNELGDTRPFRAFSELLLTARDTTDPAYVGYEFHKRNYDKFLQRFVCDCVEKVSWKGYSVFGLQFYGECWSGPRAACTYKSFGKGRGCVNEKMTRCSDRSSLLCSGDTSQHVYAYVRADSPGGATCPTKSPSTPPPKTAVPIGPPTVKCGNVEYKLTKLGCWNEKTHSPKAFPELLLTAKDKTSNVYVGYDFHKTKYDVFLQRFVCDCVAKVTQKGYSVFGLQFYGECWSGPRAGCTYNRLGKAAGCVDEKFQRCSDKSSRLCSGQSSTTVYAYVPVNAPGGATCPTTSPATPSTPPPKTVPTPGPPTVKCGNVEYKLTKLGCWSETTRPPRAFPELLLTAKDKTSNVYVGYDFHKTKYDVFLQRFVCDCVAKVTQKGYSVFGMQFYGECWSGPRAGCTYNRFGKATGCVNGKFQKCSDKSSRLCSGQSSTTIYAYVPVNAPGGATCPTTSPVTPSTTPSPLTTTARPGPPTVQCARVEYKLTKLGCWNEITARSTARALPELLLTARDKTSAVYAGYDIDTGNYAAFLERFVCDCVSQVTNKGYFIFGLQYYGECWSGGQAQCTYMEHGKADNCVNEQMKQCSDESSMLCSGDRQTNIYVYVRSDRTLPTCPSTTTTPTSITSTTPPTTQATLPTTSATLPTTPATLPTTRTAPSSTLPIPTTHATLPTSPTTLPTTLATLATTPSTTPDTLPTTPATLPTTPTTLHTTPSTTPATLPTTLPTTSTAPTSTFPTPPTTSAIPPTTPITTPTSTPPAPTPTIPPFFACNKTLDIVIAVDSSGSVMDIPFQRIKSFISKLTTRFTSTPPTYFSIIYYNYNVITLTTLEEKITNSLRLRNLIRDMRYLGQATLTQKALTTAQTLFDDGERVATPAGVEKVLIVFTDGRTYGGKQTLREPLKKLRETGVRVTAVAEGPMDYLDRYSLLLIAEKNSNLVITPSLDGLPTDKIEREIDRVTHMACTSS